MKKWKKQEVALLCKKGHPMAQENYRPISLLNLGYKVIAAVLKIRIESGIEHELGQTQFGFRTGKSTTQAIYIARRMQELA